MKKNEKSEPQKKKQEQLVFKLFTEIRVVPLAIFQTAATIDTDKRITLYTQTL